ncbi:hypothetical protein EK21DRAFT_116067 [Setomelanomma holmii]|uniref:Uncharacterized protein n=1 Tax=Setomelanomma holmii TaxID=210430 RepID=A0A9P4H248_9PLEO|nr:hypothetical protein EK21DRAFT_116067 [Setomelanomma holmii]
MFGSAFDDTYANGLVSGRLTQSGLPTGRFRESVVAALPPQDGVADHPRLAQGELPFNASGGGLDNAAHDFGMDTPGHPAAAIRCSNDLHNADALSSTKTTAKWKQTTSGRAFVPYRPNNAIDTPTFRQPTIEPIDQPQEAMASTSTLVTQQLRRYRLSESIIKYIYDMDKRTDKSKILDQIETEWKGNAAHYRTTAKTLYNTFDSVLFAWLDLQRIYLTSLTLINISDGNGSHKASRFLIWNQLRTKYLTWSTTKYATRGGAATAALSLTMVFECLALVPQPPYGSTGRLGTHAFSYTPTHDLSVDYAELAHRIQDSIAHEQLVYAATYGCDFGSDIDNLLDRYGEDIWDIKNVHGSHVRTPGAYFLYPYHLV